MWTLGLVLHFAVLLANLPDSGALICHHLGGRQGGGGRVAALQRGINQVCISLVCRWAVDPKAVPSL